jgi:uncharacterized protein with HEPN domain
MSHRDWVLRVEDILEAIDRITQYTAGMTWEAFSTDQKTLDAVIRNIEVIGEASRHIPDDIVAQHPGIPWDEMRGMRNVLIHEYFLVSVPVLWQTVVQDLSPLVPKLRRILSENRD